MDRPDVKGAARLESEWLDMEGRLNEDELAMLFIRLFKYRKPPLDTCYRENVIDGKFETYAMPLLTRDARKGYLLFAYHISSNIIYLLAIDARDGHFAACERAKRELYEAFGFVNPSVE